MLILWMTTFHAIHAFNNNITDICTAKPCKTDCVGKWENVTECVAKSPDMCGNYAGKESFIYNITVPSLYGGTPCLYPHEFRRTLSCSIPCNTGPVVVRSLSYDKTDNDMSFISLVLIYVCVCVIAALMIYIFICKRCIARLRHNSATIHTTSVQTTTDEISADNWVTTAVMQQNRVHPYTPNVYPLPVLMPV